MSTDRVLLFSLIVAASAVFAEPASAGERLTGTWLTEDGSTQVAFTPCGNLDCGQIVWLREPIDPETGSAWRDKHNPDESLKGRPLVGLTMVLDLRATTPGTWGGTLYNPLDGNSYSGRFQMLDFSKMQLKGCALAGLLCQTETWARVK
ncbi:DUF2147 domain-containing protein [Methylosinus sp. Sm6]|uniref:DUF2147 domain-containing protein n=1 Tax=Methylosinus sp. Sm6 TaxID=2866948 RepID=UPI001C99545A|nr:DUF2147 domain-containing protein [Methylosinus sp. Sm6]MBY6242912.1 DUF2147 domain-containing protein [Methylosinus sp. Sm6]